MYAYLYDKDIKMFVLLKLKIWWKYTDVFYSNSEKQGF